MSTNVVSIDSDAASREFRDNELKLCSSGVDNLPATCVALAIDAKLGIPIEKSPSDCLN
jgi:hypothetical protein